MPPGLSLAQTQRALQAMNGREHPNFRMAWSATKE